MRGRLSIFKGIRDMTLEALAAPMLDDSDSIFDFSHAASLAAPAPANLDSPLGADRADPELGWASRNPDRAMLFLFVTPRDGRVVDELLAPAV
jgi:hypothetical protein